MYSNSFNRFFLIICIQLILYFFLYILLENFRTNVYNTPNYLLKDSKKHSIIACCSVRCIWKVVQKVPASIYLLSVKNGNIRAMCETSSTLTIKRSERRRWYSSGVFYCQLRSAFTRCFGFSKIHFEQTNPGRGDKWFDW